MPSAQIIQLADYRQPTPTPQPLSKKDQVKQLLAEATTSVSAPAAGMVIEIRLSAANEKLLIDTLASKNIEGGINE
jgi:hypothetical protein